MKSFAGQVLVQLTITMIWVSIMLDRRRSESIVAYRLEILNEYMLILLYYLMMGYGMFVLQGKEKYTLGMLNIATLFTLILINLVVIIYDTLRNLIRWCKYKFCRSKCMLRFRKRWFQSKTTENETVTKELTEAKYKQDRKSNYEVQGADRPQ